MKAKIEIIEKSFLKRKCWLFHKWEIINNKGHIYYYQCSKCQARMVKQPDRKYQPIDWDWLTFKTDKIR